MLGSRDTGGLRTRGAAQKVLCFFNDPAPTEIYTLSLHDALPIFLNISLPRHVSFKETRAAAVTAAVGLVRSEEHTSELQSHVKLVCRLLLEKKTLGHDGRGPSSYSPHSWVLLSAARLRCCARSMVCYAWLPRSVARPPPAFF